MEARNQRKIRSGLEYDHLFPAANQGNTTILKNAVVNDTVAFIPKVVNKTLNQTKGIANVLKGNSVYETCRNTWNFVYNHIAYRKDKDGYEQIRSPSRSWQDRRQGVDCDCYTTFISSILTNLGIPHLLRITKYSRDYFQHIYPVVLHNGKEIIIDCVTDRFDYQVPYSAKKDHPMDLQYLDGIDDTGNRYDMLVNGTGTLEELGKLFKKKKKAASGSPTPPDGNTAPPSGVKNKKGLKKILNKVNKINPATLALRNGVLAGMKLNLFNIAKRLRWSYLSANQARSKGINIDKWNKLVQVRQKLENIFYGAGGNPDNLKKAMLGGKGNKDNAVHGLDGAGIGCAYDYNVNIMSSQTPLPQLLGGDLYYSENPMSALGELGEPATAATIAAASGVLAVIADTIKKIGDIFGGKGKESKDFDESANADGDVTSVTTNSGGKGKSPVPGSSDTSSSDTDNGGDGGGASARPMIMARRNSNAANNSANSNSGSNYAQNIEPDSAGGNTQASENGVVPAAKKAATAEDDGANEGKEVAKKEGVGDEKKGAWEQNKKWIIPVGIGVGVISAVVIGAAMMKSHPAHPPGKAVNGPPHKKKNHQRKTAGKKKGKKKAVALL